MKKIAALLLAVLIMATLSGCCPLLPSFGSTDKVDAEASSEQPDQIVEELPKEEPAPDAAASVTISRVDRPIKHTNGDLLIDYYYDQVFVSGNFEGVDKINAALVADMTEFFSNEADLEEMVEGAYGSCPYLPFTCTSTAVVTHNKNGILCLEQIQEWYMGGVANTTYVPFVFDLNTGETPKLEDITGKDSVSLEKEIKKLLRSYFLDFCGYSYSDTIAKYSLEDFKYTIRNGKITILFQDYDIMDDYYIIDTDYSVLV